MELPHQHQRIISGFRPTSDLTLGNYFGAIEPVLNIQNDPTKELSVFVADLHGLTDHKASDIAPYVREVIHDCLALGINPESTTLYLQSDIEPEVTQIANRVSPFVSVGELARTPNLKEKMQTTIRSGSDYGLSANAALLNYPILMAADIFSQNSELVAVGEDQEPHLEIARGIARRFNKSYGADNEPIILEPKIFATQALRILSLDGKGKMSKSNPTQAIMLSDEPKVAIKKIQRATTAAAGEWNPVIENHFMLARKLSDESDHELLAELEQDHKDGKLVMGRFKKAWGDITARKLDEFQRQKRLIQPESVDEALAYGNDRARKIAQQILNSMKSKMGM